MHTRFTSLTIAWKWTKRLTPLTPSTRRPTTGKSTNRTLRLSDHNKNHKIEASNPTPTGATIAQEVKTGPTTTMATGKTTRTTISTTSPNPTTPETVNSVHIAKF
jgi:hypothetical protein